MGSTSITKVSKTADLKKAFQAITDEDRSEYGSDWYSGSFSHHSSVAAATRTPYATEKEAEDAAYAALTDDSSSRFEPNTNALAFPFTCDTREVYVSCESRSHSENAAREALTRAAKEQKLLKRGETVETIRLHAYGVGYGATAGVSGTIVVRKPNAQTTRTQVVQVVVKGDPKDKNAAIREALNAKVRLRAGEKVTGWDTSQYTLDPETALAAPVRDVKVVSEATKGKAVTRYIVEGQRDRSYWSQEHSTWETGFSTQAEARAWITETLNKGLPVDGEAFGVTAVTRRESGEPLVVVRQIVKKTTWEVRVTITHTPANRERTIDGWVFAGWAKT